MMEIILILRIVMNKINNIYKIKTRLKHNKFVIEITHNTIKTNLF
jgi:hypothetical protein